ncbi:FAS1-like dehydratase domain-containing protein [Trujillonella humicola]|uniref:FAS1-like dehydratase domain-containing protein n=1 Tax=Trujillonella humicola TaxID=3383699 RepID=UPI003906752A
MTDAPHASVGTDPFASLADWHPTPVEDAARLDPGPVAALSRALDHAAPAAGEGDELPPLWHWLSFADWPVRSNVGEDGHPREGGLLPPIPDRRRMWAGGSVVVHEPLLVGREMQRHVEVVDVRRVSGRSGEVAFVKVRTRISQDGRLRVVDDVDVAYRSGESPQRLHARPTEEPAPQTGHPVSCAWRADEVLLFRFSALTANSHRIHYDAPYARDVEGYPGLVVHGPLLALLMVEGVRRATPRAVRIVQYRLRAPVFVHEEFVVDGSFRESDPDVVDVRVATAREAGHATAEVTLA